MSAGGSINRSIKAKLPNGEEVWPMVIVSHDKVEIAGLTFDRDQLIVALGLNPDDDG